MVKWLHGSWSETSSNALREEEKQQLAAVFEVLLAVQATSVSVELSSSDGTQGVFAESSERRQHCMGAGHQGPAHGAG